MALASRVEVSGTIFLFSRTGLDQWEARKGRNVKHDKESKENTHTTFLTSHDSPSVTVSDSNFFSVLQDVLHVRYSVSSFWCLIS